MDDINKTILIAGGCTPSEADRYLRENRVTIYRAAELATPGAGELEEIERTLMNGGALDEDAAELIEAIAACARGEGPAPIDWSVAEVDGCRYLIEELN